MIYGHVLWVTSLYLYSNLIMPTLDLYPTGTCSGLTFFEYLALHIGCSIILWHCQRQFGSFRFVDITLLNNDY